MSSASRNKRGRQEEQAIPESQEELMATIQAGLAEKADTKPTELEPKPDASVVSDQPKPAAAEVKISSRKPVVGDLVHFWQPGEKDPFAMILVGFTVTGTVNLAGWTARAQPVQRLNVEYSDEPKPRHWTWR